MIAAPVFAFGLVAFGFLGMGPVTIAVDSYGPVTDNAQSVYELSLIEQVPNIKQELKKDFNIDANFERAKEMLEENDGAGNTFKATAKPVLIGTAVVGATTMIFSIIMALTNGITENVDKLSLLHAPFFLGLDHRRRDDLLVYRRFHAGGDHRSLSRGGIHQGQYQAGRRGESVGGRQQEGGGDLHQVRAEGHAEHFHRGVFCHAGVCVRRAVLLHRLPDLDRDFRLVSGDFHGQCRRRVGQRQENRGSGAEAERTPLHDATVVGDTVGDPFKDTSSVALNPVIKFTTLFGLLAVELAVQPDTRPRRELDANSGGGVLPHFVLLRLPVVLRHAHQGLRVAAYSYRNVLK